MVRDGRNKIIHHGSKHPTNKNNTTINSNTSMLDTYSINTMPILLIIMQSIMNKNRCHRQCRCKYKDVLAIVPKISK